MATIETVVVEVKVADQRGKALTAAKFMQLYFDAQADETGMLGDDSEPGAAPIAYFDALDNKLLVQVPLNDWTLWSAIGLKKLYTVDPSLSSLIAVCVNYYMALAQGAATPTFDYRICKFVSIYYQEMVMLPPEIEVQDLLLHIGRICATEYGPVKYGEIAGLGGVCTIPFGGQDLF